MASRPIVGTSTNPFFLDAYGTQSFATPRGYHSVAVLLEDGSVALMGGIQARGVSGSYADDLTPFISEDTVEVFRPPFTFENGRARITSADPLAIMHYGQEYCLQVNDPNKVDYACLIAVGSVTHHFDYGQRYVELMIQRSGAGCTPGPPSIQWTPVCEF